MARQIFSQTKMPTNIDVVSGSASANSQDDFINQTTIVLNNKA
jgi:hypothetical protein